MNNDFNIDLINGRPDESKYPPLSQRQKNPIARAFDSVTPNKVIKNSYKEALKSQDKDELYKF
jgi:hypothetical protein